MPTHTEQFSDVLTLTAPDKRSPRFGYRDLVASLRRQIETGGLAPGDRLPSYSEMKRRGMGQATVERAYVCLEQDGLIRREAKRGIFVASQEKVLHGQIGFVVAPFSRHNQIPYTAHLMEGIGLVTERESVRLTLIQPKKPFAPSSLDGLLLHAATHDAEKFVDQGIPAVSVLNTVEGIPNVLADDFGGAKLGVRKLTSLGHRRIAALMQSDLPKLQMRTAGYQSALHEAGITPEPDWLHNPQRLIPPTGYRGWGYESMKQWLAGDWRELGCTALFVQNDMAAMGVLDAVREAGIKVPEELSILSFDGTEVCEYTWPTLAAVEVPLEQIASTGMELLLRMIRGEAIEPTMTMMPARWKDGGSVAPPQKRTVKSS